MAKPFIDGPRWSCASPPLVGAAAAGRGSLKLRAEISPINGDVYRSIWTAALAKKDRDIVSTCSSAIVTVCMCMVYV